MRGGTLPTQAQVQAEPPPSATPPTDVPLHQPGFELGGETALPFDAPPSPAPQLEPPAVDVDDPAPLEAEPLQDPDGQLAAPQAEPPAVPGSGVPVPVSEAVPPSEPAPPTPLTPSPAPAPPPPEEVQPSPPPPSRTPERDRVETRPDPKLHPRPMDPGAHTAPPQPQIHAAPTPPQQAVAAPPTSAPAVASPATTARPAPTAQAGPPPPATDGRTYVVRPGDSLWSIATAVLPRGASDARIAAEVARLWRINAPAIGTGDPDLLPVGVKIRLR